MSAFLGSRYGEHFTGAIILNPAINFPFMFNITDIPDWFNSVCFNQHHTWNLSNGEYKKLFEFSPLNTPMSIPSLLLLGAKDKRVPYQGAIAF